MDADNAIRVDGLSKEYVIVGPSERHDTFRDAFASSVRSRLGRFRGGASATQKESFWALRKVNFDVRRGEVIGVIGRNGAGKSTLLKILSRITHPTGGRVEIRGRVASLLEVGTGFHPELTGRENIHLNGAILGMTRAEVQRKFDAIVDFAGIERFLDTPVKRYSSGMYVRLAFAVAAHLEPEVLIVDEVLAVGDAEFQRKCLGKMREVSALGRTVVFVSHNIQAVQSLCSRALLLMNGEMVHDGSVEAVTEAYLNSRFQAGQTTWSDPNGIGDETVRLACLRVFSSHTDTSPFSSSHSITVEITIDVLERCALVCTGFDLIADDGTTVLRAFDTDVPRYAADAREPGRYEVSCQIPAGTLNGKAYGVAPRIGVHGRKWIVASDPLVRFEARLDHGQTAYWTALTGKTRPGQIAPILDWRSEKLSRAFQSQKITSQK